MSGVSRAIARRLMGKGGGGHRFAGPAIRVATAAVAMGMVVMLLSVAVGRGFKQEIRNKIIGFGSHIQVTSLNLNSSFETPPITINDTLFRQIEAVEGVVSVHPYITKPGIIKTDNAFQGIALKGVEHRFDTTFLSSIIVEGRLLSTPDSVRSSDIMLSRAVADMLCLSVGDPVRMFFVQEGIRARRFTLCGIFDSHIEEFDKSLAYVDMRQLTHLNGWTQRQISGYEVLVDDFQTIDHITEAVADLTGVFTDDEQEMLRVRNIRDLQPQIFGWLNLLDQNIVVIIVLIIAVAGLNMVAGLLILILEHTNTIGILKAIGCANGRLRRIFIAMAFRIVGRGLIIGDVIGVALCVLQKATGIAVLDPANYYLDTVPIMLTAGDFILLNIGTAFMAFLLLLGPSGMVARIIPTKAIRFN